MKALLCTQFGSLDDLTVADVPAPVAGPGQVLIDVKAASVNYPDALMVQGKYQVRPPCRSRRAASCRASWARSEKA